MGGGYQHALSGDEVFLLQLQRLSAPESGKTATDVEPFGEVMLMEILGAGVSCSNMANI